MDLCKIIITIFFLSFCFLLWAATDGIEHKPMFGETVVVDTVVVGIDNMVDTTISWIGDEKKEYEISYCSFSTVEKSYGNLVYTKGGRVERGVIRIVGYLIDSTTYDTVCYEIKESCE